MFSVLPKLIQNAIMLESQSLCTSAFKDSDWHNICSQRKNWLHGRKETMFFNIILFFKTVCVNIIFKWKWFYHNRKYLHQIFCRIKHSVGVFLYCTYTFVHGFFCDILFNIWSHLCPFMAHFLNRCLDY